MSWRRAESLNTYIKRKYKSKSAFARAIGVDRQQVTKWSNNNHVVVRGRLYSLRRNLHHIKPAEPKRIDTTTAMAELEARPVIERGVE